MLFPVFSRESLSRMQFKWIKSLRFSLSLLILCLSHSSGCVTQTERIYPYESRDENVWEELQREFGWQNRESSHEISRLTEPFYKRVIHGLTATASEWFSEGDNHLSEREIVENRRHFNRQREAALQRLREQQELDANEME